MRSRALHLRGPLMAAVYEGVGVIWTRLMSRFVPSGTCDCGHAVGTHMSGPQTRCVECRCNAFFPSSWLPR